MMGLSETFVRNVMSGAQRGPEASILRFVTRAIEPVYSGITSLRNHRYDSGKRESVRLDRPVVSIGNLTTGGTGKTPVVQWLAAELRTREWRTAVLSRGYRSAESGIADESRMLEDALNAGEQVPVYIRANPDRVASARAWIQEHPEIDLFLLDDGFQHRRVRREIDLVLVNAVEPFGYDHVLPRGMLREPMKGLGRATAFIVTRADDIDASGLESIERRLKTFNPSAPVFRAAHEQSAVVDLDGRQKPITPLQGTRFFSFCGIADPAGFERQLARHAPGGLVGSRRFGDHHAYTRAELNSLQTEAAARNAQMLITTAKDWVKIRPLIESGTALPVCYVELRLRFFDHDGEQLLARVEHLLETDPRSARKKRLHGGG